MNNRDAEVSASLRVEQRIVRRLCRELKKAGYLPDSVWDGGEYVKARTARDVIGAVFAVSSATIHFDRGRGANGHSHGVFVVLGNGVDCLSDWHIGDKAFDAVVDRVSASTEECA
jgi:hypothetical protein